MLNFLSMDDIQRNLSDDFVSIYLEMVRYGSPFGDCDYSALHYLKLHHFGDSCMSFQVLISLLHNSPSVVSIAFTIGWSKAFLSVMDTCGHCKMQ